MRRWFLSVLALVVSLGLSAALLDMAGVLDVSAAAWTWGQRLPGVGPSLRACVLGREASQELRAAWREVEAARHELEARQAALQAAQAKLVEEERRLAAVRAQAEAQRRATTTVKPTVEPGAKSREARPGEARAQLLAAYAAMAPEQVAAILGQLPRTQAVELLTALDPAQAAAVLGALDPRQAAMLTGYVWEAAAPVQAEAGARSDRSTGQSL